MVDVGTNPSLTTEGFSPPRDMITSTLVWFRGIDVRGCNSVQCIPRLRQTRICHIGTAMVNRHDNVLPYFGIFERAHHLCYNLVRLFFTQNQQGHHWSRDTITFSLNLLNNRPHISLVQGIWYFAIVELMPLQSDH